MDKIRALLEQLGGSKELVDQIIESLEAYKTKTEETIKEEYRERLAKAKEACLEEVNEYKRDLARKTQIFFESRVEKIEQQIAKQVAVKDSAAEAKLQQIVALLEGVEVNGDGNNADIQAAMRQVKELQEQVRKLDTSKKVLTEKANRAHAIAEKTLERNKVLSKELAEAAKKPGKSISEGKKTKKAEKGKANSKPKDKGDKPLTEGRKRSEAATTRRTSDGQLARSKSKSEPSSPAPQSMGSFTPESIAANMD